ncbi:hypothetical protein ONS95_013719 [Cadophora gregata]|uniref:uncharacterized protein n=1 Tax=Cadophora gregata TaxID=51156 RepID=UPI0026DAF6D4|nr:uncharacterized protein ONS95_013719 [Cadophora gregata]KAK0113461.1 hypothetical protein ONS96_014327 [Cadophora gregata f. sp. sojae]KAK0114220.1 hypothetical protein ONS95_013719 [Cadophora gregata]
MLLSLLSFISFMNLSIQAPVIAERLVPSTDFPSSALNITTRDVQYANFDSIDARGLCDTNFGKHGQCSFVTWTHWPATDTLEDSSHAFYAFDSSCKVIGYVPAVNMKGNDKYAFGPGQTKLQYFIDVRFSVKKEHGWAPNIWYGGRFFKDSKCWYEETRSGWRHSQGVCKIAFTC